MWRYFAGGAGALVLAFAAMFLFRGSAAPEVTVPPAPVAVAGEVQEAMPEEAPRAADRTREQKRFDRLDKDKNDAVSREEFLNLRRRAFAKLDKNGDGKLSFDEWAVRTTTRFAGADKDKSGALNRGEFATTAPKRRPAQPKCACPKPAAKAAPKAESAEEEGGEE